MADSREVRALAALLAEAQGQELDSDQKADCQWYLRKVCKERLFETVSELSKADYCRMAGLHANTLVHQMARLNLPMGAKVDLPAVLRRHHEIHTESGIAKTGRAGEDPEKQLKIEQLQKKNELLDIELRKKKGDFIDRVELALKLERLIGRLAAIGATLGKRFGADAQKLLNQGLESIEADFDDQDAD